MSSEKQQRQRIIKALRPLHACSVENICRKGFPDIIFIGGVLECKCAKEWPRRGGVLKLKHHFEPLQRLFARIWTRKGGFHAVCLQVGQDWFLLPPVAAADHLEVDWTEEDIRREAWWGSRGMDDEDFLKAVKERLK